MILLPPFVLLRLARNDRIFGRQAAFCASAGPAMLRTSANPAAAANFLCEFMMENLRSDRGVYFRRPFGDWA
jgi:hypothetical protein